MKKENLVLLLTFGTLTILFICTFPGISLLILPGYIKFVFKLTMWLSGFPIPTLIF